MSFRSLTMIDVREVLRRWQAAHGARQIARETGYDRKTVARYVDAAERCELPRDRPLSDDEVHEVAQRVQSRPLPDPSQEWNEVAQHRERIEGWLQERRPLKLRKIHTLLKREGVTASYDTLRRFAIKELNWGKPRTTVLVDEPPPAQEAQVDFGQMGMIDDEESQGRRMLWTLIITLGFSRLSFVWPTYRQTTEAIIEGLEAAWVFFGGVVRTLIPDNPTTMIICPDAISARLNEVFADLRNGLTRLRCPRCGKDMLVAHSGKGRGICPSCGGRRMAATALHIVRKVLPDCPVRQWVLSVPFPARRLLAVDARLFGAVVKLFARVVDRFYLERSRAAVIEAAKTGALFTLTALSDPMFCSTS